MIKSLFSFLKYFFFIICKFFFTEHFLLIKEKIGVEFLLVNSKEHTAFEILIQMLILGEDHRFKKHIGFDCIGILRAIKNRLLYNRIEGASTVEQQLVRVLTGDYERTITRKIREIFLATTLSFFVPRNFIPIIYLKIAYFGYGMKGIYQAGIALYGIRKIDIAMSAALIARLKYPEPKIYCAKRRLKIENRTTHLLNLYNKQYK
ncbi:biosynthetic peptidoglycan transglycosylase [Anditalea andensis]|uniref:Glycosyl transferase family 51 domain-containing protein n=1 Tax=Anditalea andensis TaxID=1048983 RepID=A0A074KS02_9BACT|nr:biosynthetic peptidoglycan transglycosylase [Anditalea andensis]KEO71659.1 hypothetical protein EL17_23405 [Anditalea andensis]